MANVWDQLSKFDIHYGQCGFCINHFLSSYDFLCANFRDILEKQWLLVTRLSVLLKNDIFLLLELYSFY